MKVERREERLSDEHRGDNSIGAGAQGELGRAKGKNFGRNGADSDGVQPGQGAAWRAGRGFGLGSILLMGGLTANQNR